MYFEEVVLEYVVCMSLALNGDQWWTVLDTLIKHSILYVWVTSSQLFISYEKAQFNWNFCPCLQDVSKTALVMKSLLVSLICSWNRTEKNRIQDQAK